MPFFLSISYQMIKPSSDVQTKPKPYLSFDEDSKWIANIKSNSFFKGRLFVVNGPYIT